MTPRPEGSCAAVLAGSLATALALSTPVARAQTPTPWRLDYRVDAAAARCPDARAFTDQVGASLGLREPFATDAPSVVRVELTRRGGAFVGAYATARDGGPPSNPRTFTAPRCERVVDDLARSVGIVLDPLALVRAASPPPPPTPPLRPSPAEDVVPQAVSRERPPPVMQGDPPPAPSRAAVARGRVLAAVTAGASLGAIDTAAPLVSLRLAARLSRWSLGVDLRGDLPVSRAVPGLSVARVTSFALSGALVACAHFGVAAACALVGAGGVYRDASGVGEATPGTAPWAFAGGRAALTWALSARWSVVGQLDVLGAIVRPVPSLASGTVGQTAALWDPWPVHLAASVGAQVALP